jgi:DNA mismatch endonuclease (patch repair protein)
MSRIRSQNTQIEKVVFRELSKRRIYFQKYYKRAIGNPDIALPRKKKAIFIDGDFWHGYQFNKLKKRLPRGYWLEKIERNVKRDKSCRAKLKRDGWKIMRIWEHDIKKDINRVAEKVVLFINK